MNQVNGQISFETETLPSAKHWFRVDCFLIFQMKQVLLIKDFKAKVLTKFKSVQERLLST